MNAAPYTLHVLNKNEMVVFVGQVEDNIKTYDKK
jgi:hypothetical protein